jgi:hypothetical protein
LKTFVERWENYSKPKGLTMLKVFSAIQQSSISIASFATTFSSHLISMNDVG